MRKRYEIQNQTRLEVFRPIGGLPSAIVFGAAVSFELSDDHISYLLHDGLEALELQSKLSLTARSWARFSESILNHSNLKSFTLNGILSPVPLYKLLHRSKVSDSLLRLHLSSLTLQRRVLFLLSKAIPQNGILKTLIFFRCRFECLGTQTEWVWKLRKSNLRCFKFDGVHFDFNELFVFSKCLQVCIGANKTPDKEKLYITARMDNTMGNEDLRKAAAKHFLSSIALMGRLQVFAAAGMVSLFDSDFFNFFRLLIKTTIFSIM